MRLSKLMLACVLCLAGGGAWASKDKATQQSTKPGWRQNQKAFFPPRRLVLRTERLSEVSFPDGGKFAPEKVVHTEVVTKTVPLGTDVEGTRQYDIKGHIELAPHWFANDTTEDAGHHAFYSLAPHRRIEIIKAQLIKPSDDGMDRGKLHLTAKVMYFK